MLLDYKKPYANKEKQCHVSILDIIDVIRKHTYKKNKPKNPKPPSKDKDRNEEKEEYTKSFAQKKSGDEVEERS